MSEDKPYKVGYKRPPMSGQFKKGQSGNPKGRPKARKSLNVIVEDVLSKKVVIREGGKTKKVTQLEALIRRVVVAGLKGDHRATDQVIKMLRGVQEPQGDDGSGFGSDDLDGIDDSETISNFLKLHDIADEPSDEGIEDGSSDDTW
jgi:Family of unknown function (DUF5681)